MATMIPCPACEKKISGEAVLCPKCGQPITEEARAEALKKAKEEKTAGRVGCGVILLLSVFLAWYFSPNEEEQAVSAAISATLKPGERVGTLDIADMCGGKAVVMNDAADYWILGDKAFAANGIAMGYSPGAPLSPPSIGHDTVQRALAGEKIVAAPNLGMSYGFFLMGVMKAAKELNLPPMRKDGYVGVILPLPNGMQASVNVEESCGFVTKVTAQADFAAKTKESESTLRVLFTIMPRLLAPDMPDAERDVTLEAAFQQAVNNKGEYVPLRLGNTQCRLIFLQDSKNKEKGQFTLEARI